MSKLAISEPWLAVMVADPATAHCCCCRYTFITVFFFLQPPLGPFSLLFSLSRRAVSARRPVVGTACSLRHAHNDGQADKHVVVVNAVWRSYGAPCARAGRPRVANGGGAEKKKKWRSALLSRLHFPKRRARRAISEKKNPCIIKTTPIPFPPLEFFSPTF